MPGSEFNKDLNDVGKLDNPYAPAAQASRRKNVGKLNNPFDNGAAPAGKPKSRRLSKVGKLNSPFEQNLGEGQEVRSFSRNTSRRSSISSRRSSICESDVSEDAGEGVSSAFMLEMNSAMQGLAELAAKASNDDDQWGKSNNSSNNSDEE